mmetsp:Transcript_29819/g.86537  ORF Transcript_29819/g.86537 Transcript_29819/m.86537 type:complete len:284 (+) Transcript_29819:1481-2332(+)
MEVVSGGGSKAELAGRGSSAMEQVTDATASFTSDAEGILPVVGATWFPLAAPNAHAPPCGMEPPGGAMTRARGGAMFDLGVVAVANAAKVCGAKGWSATLLKTACLVMGARVSLPSAEGTARVLRGVVAEAKAEFTAELSVSPSVIDSTGSAATLGAWLAPWLMTAEWNFGVMPATATDRESAELALPNVTRFDVTETCRNEEAMEACLDTASRTVSGTPAWAKWRFMKSFQDTRPFKSQTSMCNAFSNEPHVSSFAPQNFTNMSSLLHASISSYLSTLPSPS